MKPKDKRTQGKPSTAAEQNRSDLQDSPRDEARLQPDEATIDLPDVRDIPGQEHVHPPSLGELADTTIASDDEEGTAVFGRDSEEAASMGTTNEPSSTVTRNETNVDDTTNVYRLDEDQRESKNGTTGIP